MKIKLNGLLAAGLLVVLANGFILVHVARNRAGTPVAEFELTDHELRLLGYGEDNSGVGLSLIYQNPSGYPYQYPGLIRKAYLALEYDGPAWQQWREQQEKKAAGPDGRQLAADTVDQSSHLVLIDVGSDIAALRRKYPDTKKVLILPGASRGLDAKAWARVEVGWIHVPVPLSGALKGAAHYRVRLRQGPSLEIWVAEVQRIVG
jgi:hypothetical protein